MDPLNTPSRDVAPNRRRREPETRGGLWTLLGIAVILGVGILYLHRGDFGLGGLPGPSLQSAAQSGGQGAASSGDADSPRAGSGAWTGGVNSPSEEGLQMAAPLQEERYAAPVTHVTETEACRALRNSRVELRAALKKSPGAARKAELEDELAYVESRGTQRGCWSGGAS